MVRFLSFAAFLIAAWLNAQAPAIEWEQAWGGTGTDTATAVEVTTDGGYIIIGTSNSNDGDIHDAKGNDDLWLIKLDSSGALQWKKSLGGTLDDKGSSIRQTADGGYIMTGSSASSNGDVAANYGSNDVWVVKTDSSGNIEWEKNYGGGASDWATFIKITTDGGYIVTGVSWSGSLDVGGNYGGPDYWVFKIDSAGVMEWEQNFGGSGLDWAYEVQPTTDGGYILTGHTVSGNYDITNPKGMEDAWIVKMDSTGNMQWQKSLGGSHNDKGNSIKQTSDGGYIMAGVTSSNDKDVSSNKGGSDAWIVKMNSTGDIQWEKTYGGTLNDSVNSIQLTADGGYVVVGSSNSSNNDVSENKGQSDVWIFKINSTGDLLWEKSIGGSGNDSGIHIKSTNDGGYILVASSTSNDGDVTGGHGGDDIWVVKLSAETVLCSDPALTSSIVDADGDEINGCIPAGGEFYVELTLTDGSGNSSYTVSDGDSSQSMNSGDTATFGPYVAGTNPSFTAEGDDDATCGADTSAYSPEICPASGDSCDWRIRVWANNNGEGVTWYLKDQNGTVVSGTGTAGPFNFVSQTYNLEGPVTFYLNGNDQNNPGDYRSVNYYVLRDGAKVYHGRARNNVVHIKNITCDDLPEPETVEEACNWTVRVWSSKNGADTSWSIENENYQVLAGESNRPATYNDIRTFNAAGPLTFKLNTDLGSYRSVNYNIINPRGKIKSGTVRYEDLVITDLTCEDPQSSAKSNAGAVLTDFKFSYHPNPAKDVLYINSTKEVKEINAYNLSGQQVLNFKDGLGTSNELKLGLLPEGVYVFRAILEDGQVETFKVIIK